MKEFYVETELTQSNSGVNLSFLFTNHSAWPARVEDNISYRYYMDLSEVLAAGYSASDVVVRVDRDQAEMYSGYTPATVSEITHYQGNIYYIEVTYPDGRVALPISEGHHQCELMLALVFPNYGSGWDALNDYSNQDLLENEETYVITDRIPLYQNGVLISGMEPDGTTPAATDITEPVTPDLTLGDINLDNMVRLNDLVLLVRYLLAETSISQDQYAQADVNSDHAVNGIDAAALRQRLIE